MTKKSYSNDLRLRVIEQIKSVSKPRGGSKGKLDPSQLEEYAKQNPNQTLEEIGKAFGVSDCAIHKRLKALGFKYKKKTLNIWKQIKNEEKPI
jgi:transposase